MNRILFIVAALVAATCFEACNRDDEPFEYPDGEVTEPTTVTHMTRLIQEEENWLVQAEAEGCDENFPTSTFAITELNTSRGFITLYLVPDSSTCSTYAEAGSQFAESEVPSDYWDNWTFEMTFSELQVNPATSLRLELAYREVALSLDLAPFMRQTIAQDTNAQDISGLFYFQINQGFTTFRLNEFEWEPDFSEGSGNSFRSDADVKEPMMKLSIEAEDTEARSLIVMTFARVTSYGIPEKE